MDCVAIAYNAESVGVPSQLKEFLMGFGRIGTTLRAMIKLDFRKAFNSVRWGAVERMMKKFRLCEDF